MAMFEAQLYDLISIRHLAAFLLSSSHQRVMYSALQGSRGDEHINVYRSQILKSKGSNIRCMIDMTLHKCWDFEQCQAPLSTGTLVKIG